MDNQTDFKLGMNIHILTKLLNERCGVTYNCRNRSEEISLPQVDLVDHGKDDLVWKDSEQFDRRCLKSFRSKMCIHRSFLTNRLVAGRVSLSPHVILLRALEDLIATADYIT